MALLFSLLNDSFTAKNLTNYCYAASVDYCYYRDLSVGATIALVGMFAALGYSLASPLASIMAIIAAKLINNGIHLINEPYLPDHQQRPDRSQCYLVHMNAFRI